MNDRWSQLYRILLLLGDFTVLLLAFTVSYIVRVKLTHRPLAENVYARDYLIIFLSILPFWLMLFAFLGLYNKQVYENRPSQVARLIIGSAVGIMFVISYSFFARVAIFPARIVPLYAFGFALLLLLIEREVMRWLRFWAYRHKWGITRVMLIGNAEATRELASLMRGSMRTGYKVVSIVGRKSAIPKGMHGIHHFRTIPVALAKLKELDIDTVVQTEWYQEHEINTRILEAAQQLHLGYKFIPTQSEFYTNSNTVELFQGLPTVSVHPTPLVGWGRIVKRAFDTGTSVLALIVLSPVFLLIALLIKLTDPKGPIIFYQERVTRHGRLFRFYKFRSMKHQYSGISAITAFTRMKRPDLVKEYEKYRKVADDPRITTVGKFLRKFSLDELPQFWNVARGDISLVGPRAFLPEELDLYQASPLLLSVRTGITGLWQVSGRSNLTFEQRLELELYYVQNWSFWSDIRIILRTFKVVLFGKGAK
ncbi:MAG TPA: sugar transferase [Candidatus Saccharimonadales bacterium]|nr:sugar transferase [Candidatus Saccharimonadales bacterium]